MDIFAIAEQGMKIQDEEIKAVEKAVQDEKDAKKAYKLDLFNVVLPKIAQKDYGWLGRESDGSTSDEKRKGFEPFIANMFLGKAVSPDKGRAITLLDIGYAEILKRVNSELNANIFSASKEMAWLLACSINPYDIDRINIDNIKAAKRKSEEKYDKRVIKYLAKELWSSQDKIYDMIEAGLISADDMKSIEEDLDTLEARNKNGKLKKK